MNWQQPTPDQKYSLKNKYTDLGGPSSNSIEFPVALVTPNYWALHPHFNSWWLNGSEKQSKFNLCCANRLLLFPSDI